MVQDPEDDWLPFLVVLVLVALMLVATGGALVRLMNG